MKYFFTFLISLCVCSVEAQIGRLDLSPRQKIHQNIGLTNITIDYSRPSMRGRIIFGDLLPYGEYWRTGANQNSTIEFDQIVFLGDTKVEKGKYRIITRPSKTAWEFILYDEIDGWDVPDEIIDEKIIATIEIPVKSMTNAQEVLSIEIGDFTNYTFDLKISWENSLITVPVQLNTRALMDEKIANQLNGPDYADYYLAATYQMESGGEYEKGLEWILKAMEISEEVGWWDYRVQMILLQKLERRDEAKDVCAKGLQAAKADKRTNMIVFFEQELAKF